MRITLLFICLIFFSHAQAQLGFCSGSKGDPIFQEDFGQGSGTGNELATGLTNYRFVRNDPQDGEYTISDDIGNQIGSWHSNLPSTTNSGGRALIVNADFTAGQFYKVQVSGLCENTTYEFSAYLINVYNRGSGVCNNGGIPINVRFEIWDETDSILLKAGNTGDIMSRNTPSWEQYALTFQSEPGQNSVILKMFNNADGGCGNDLAIDDIIFRSCGDLTTVNSEDGTTGTLNICEENTPQSITLNATADNSVYVEHYYQWQQSENETDWQDIEGANLEEYTSEPLTTSKYFRVKVAEDPTNLANNLCSSASVAFYVDIIPTPTAPQTNGDVSICSDENIPQLQVNVGANETVNWYSEASGGELLAENTLTYTPQSAGIFYAEAINIISNCEPGPRTLIQLSISSAPEVTDEELQICPDSSLELDAGITGLHYSWNTGESSQSIQINTSGTYTVTISTPEGCTATKTFLVNPVDNAAIAEVNSEEEKVIIGPMNEGNFLYSLDGENYQASNVFNSVPGGIYTAYITDRQSCKVDSKLFAHIVIPKYITPNNDGYHDSFNLNGVEYFETSKILIFDRYGKNLKTGSGVDFGWQGKLNGVELPSDDYWYVIKIKGFPDKKGHFTLLR